MRFWEIPILINLCFLPLIVYLTKKKYWFTSKHISRCSLCLNNAQELENKQICISLCLRLVQLTSWGLPVTSRRCPPQLLEASTCPSQSRADPATEGTGQTSRPSTRNDPKGFVIGQVWNASHVIWVFYHVKYIQNQWTGKRHCYFCWGHCHSFISDLCTLTCDLVHSVCPVWNTHAWHAALSLRTLYRHSSCFHRRRRLPSEICK